MKTTREQIVEAADELFYHKGYEHTSFSDIASVVKISRGNFYYHFKTKDEILRAVIHQRLSSTHAMLHEWEAQSVSPEERVKSFINILLINYSKIKKYGCPVGTLCGELVKLNHTSQVEAYKLFALFREWLRSQFVLLGHYKEADKLAMHVLAWSQGIASITNSFKDKNFVEHEVKQIESWLESL